MPFVDFRTEPVGGRPTPWPVAAFTVTGVPGVEIRNTSPGGANGVTAFDELVIAMPSPASNVLVDLLVGNAITIEALDAAGAVVGTSSFARDTGPAAAVFSTPSPIIERIRMVRSATEARITMVFSA